MRAIPRLETARTVLTIPPASAAPRALDYFVRNRARFEPVSPPWAKDFFTVEYFARSLASAAEDFRADRALRLQVFRRGERGGPVIGAVNFTQFCRFAFQRCILGYSVDGAHEGQGLLREALEAAIAYVFDELRFHRIEANHLPDNERSANLLRRLGFSVEGYARDYLFIAGAWRDHVLNAKTNPTPMVP